MFRDKYSCLLLKISIFIADNFCLLENIGPVIKYEIVAN